MYARLTIALQRTPASPHTRQLFHLTSPRISPSSSSSLYKPVASPFNRQFHNFQKRTMSSAPAKKEFLCILPDKPGAQAKRLEVRPTHLEGAKSAAASGSLALGGAMLAAHPAEGEVPTFKGSSMLVLADNEAEVRAILENDIYSKSGVWDLENAQIIPFKSAIRQSL